jgi:hypothetical protein
MAGCGALLLNAQDVPPAIVLKTVKEPAARGTLSDRREFVRGDTGKWNDRATLQHAPPLERKPQGLSLDEWAEQLAEQKSEGTVADEHWLIFRSRQLDDNDRVWIERIERRANEFTITMNEATWKNRYFKSFTYYEVTAVNLGRLPRGHYTVKWVVRPLTFKQLEKPPQPNRDNKDNWPLDAQPGEGTPSELKTTFSVRE